VENSFDKPQKLSASYLKEIIGSIEWPDELKDLPIAEKYKMALHIQQNLQMARMFDMLAIATGLVEGDEIPDPDGQIGEVSDKKMEEGLRNSMLCGACGEGVVPNRMGYCPRCGNDLRKQHASEILNKGK
jgi:hypothetical protein